MENGESAYEAGSDLRKGLDGPTEGAAHNCESNGDAARLRLDQPLVFAVIADCDSGRVDAARQGGFREDLPVPNGREQVVPTHHPVAVSQQILQQVEDLRLDRAQLTAAAQLAPVGVDREIIARKQQLESLSKRYNIRRAEGIISKINQT
jgi:hypothetical protein